MSTTRNAALDRARTFLTFLVVAHHSVLAYIAFGRLDHRDVLRSTAPIVDAHRWIGFDMLVLFDDSFFMAAMFLLSGLFVWPGLRRLGAAGYAGRRLLRLGLPFILAVSVLMPLAYYASFLQAGSNLEYGAFWWRCLTIGPWPGGPAWFIWVLLLLDLAAAGLYRLVPASRTGVLALSSLVHRRPVVAMLVGLAISVPAVYAMTLPFGITRWFSFGPFAIQASRVLLYPLYFIAGVVIGAAGIGAAGAGQGVLRSDGVLARNWVAWVCFACGVFSLLAVLVVLRLALAAGGIPLGLRLGYEAWLALCCASLVIALLALFLRFAGGARGWLDHLRHEAYGIYLVHYLFVLWLQYALLGLDWPGAAKAAAVFVLSVGLSWGSVRTLRLVPGVARVL
jgi:hypothetical protein